MYIIYIEFFLKKSNEVDTTGVFRTFKMDGFPKIELMAFSR